MAEVRVGIFTPVGPFANGAGQRSTIRGYSATGSFLQTAATHGCWRCVRDARIVAEAGLDRHALGPTVRSPPVANGAAASARRRDGAPVAEQRHTGWRSGRLPLLRFRASRP
jgi:hypothetical protein